MAIIVKPSRWQGREDQEESPEKPRRWHHQVVLPEDGLPKPKQCSGLLGFCCDIGVQRNGGRIGAVQGPAALRQQLCDIAWHGGNHQVVDFGDVAVEGEDLEIGQLHLSEQVAAIVHQVNRLLVVGGGHETAYGSFWGLHKALGTNCKIGIVNLDAHFDLRCPGARGPSSGTPFFQIQALTGADNFHYCCLGVAEESNTETLFQRADKWGVRYRTDIEMNTIGLQQIKMELQYFAQSCDALYLTVDMDVLPHYQTPGVSSPAARGVRLEVVEMVIDQLVESAQYCRFGLPLVEITELNPVYDLQGVTARTAAVLAGRMLSI